MKRLLRAPFFDFRWGDSAHSTSLNYHRQSHLQVSFYGVSCDDSFIASRVEKVYNNKSSWKVKAAACLLSCCQPAEIFLLTEP